MGSRELELRVLYSTDNDVNNDATVITRPEYNFQDPGLTVNNNLFKERIPPKSLTNIGFSLGGEFVHDVINIRNQYVIDSLKDKNIYIIFAYDAEYKLELIIEMIAAKEMYLGRYYLEKEKWIAAMNRFKNVVEKYDKTIYIEEALFRLVEIHYKLGMIDESKKFAKLLGYNYQSSEWYLASYKIFNKDYKKIKKIEKSTKVSLVDKLKSLID